MKPTFQTKGSSLTAARTSQFRSGLLQRKCACGGTTGPTGECEDCRKRETKSLRRPIAHPSEVPLVVDEVLRSPGEPLDAHTRSFMEPRFGHRFGDVRVHTDARAAESAHAVNALAYTVGRHIVFGQRRYQPETQPGANLLAHELTHAIQQDAAGSNLQARLKISRSEDPAEREADAIADQITRGHTIGSVQEKAQSLARQQISAGAAAKGASVAKEDPGGKRARVAKELVDKLKAAGTTYKKEYPRDWNNTKISDCTKFVQWALEDSDEGELFGRKSGTTSAMQSIIQKLRTDQKPAFRFTEPEVGDIMMWGGHVGIVYEVVNKQGTNYLVFAHMGIHGASLVGKSIKQGKDDMYWLKASDTAKIDEMGDGPFLGFWTPP